MLEDIRRIRPSGIFNGCLKAYQKGMMLMTGQQAIPYEEFLAMIGWLYVRNEKETICKLMTEVQDESECMVIDTNNLELMQVWFAFNMECPFFDEVSKLAELSDI